MVLQSVSRDDSVGFCKTKNVNKQKPLLNRKLIKRTILAMIFENVKKVGQYLDFQNQASTISEIFWSLLPFQS